MQDKDAFKPKIRRAKTTSHIFISLPPNSVAFFVLPGARLQVCIDNEKETELLLEEIENDQNSPLPEELEFMMGSRSTFGRNSMLQEITQHLKEELTFDRKYYNSESIKSRKQEDVKEEDKSLDGKLKDKGRKFLIDRAKQKKSRDFDKRRDELKKFLLERTKNKKTDKEIKSEAVVDSYAPEMNKSQTDTTLKEKNAVFTDEKLEKLISEASHKFTKRDINMQLLRQIDDSESPYEIDNSNKKRTTDAKTHTRKPRDLSVRRSQIKDRLGDTKQKIIDRRNEILENAQSRKDSLKNKLRTLKHSKGGQRFKRDINMDLLKVKAEKKTEKNENPKKAATKLREKAATLRLPGQTSEEILEEMEFLNPHEDDDVKEVSKKVEVFAELANSDYDENEDIFDTSNSKKTGFFGQKNKRNKKKPRTQDHLQFLTSSEEFTDIEEDLPCIHEFYGQGGEPVDKEWDKVVYELGEYSSDAKKDKRKKKKKKESVSFSYYGFGKSF